MSARRLTLQFLGMVALAVALLLAADPSTPAATLPASAAAALGLLVGTAAFALVTGRRAWSTRTRALPPRPAIAVVLAVWAAAEEVLWRWFVLGELAPPLGALAAGVAATVVFACAHRRHRRAHLLTGAAFAGVYVGTGSLVAACLAHAAYNLCTAAVSRARAPTGEAAA